MTHHRYSVYGMANALLDLEFEVDFDFLARHNITKGFSTLIDLPAQQALIQDLGAAQCKQVHAGGSVANSLLMLQHLGASCFYACKIADDRHGDLYLEALNQAGLASSLPAVRASGNTGTCLVLITPDADRTMKSYLGITESFSTENLDLAALERSEYLFVEGYMVTSPSALEAIHVAMQHARAYGVKIAMSLSDPGLVTHFKSQIQSLLADPIDLLFCNQDEAREYTGYADLKEAALALKQVAQRLVITRGDQGSWIFDGDSVIEIPAYPAKAINTLGAGDMYAGTFLYGLTQNLSCEKAGHLASRAAAMIVSQYGSCLSREQAGGLKDSLDFKI